MENTLENKNRFFALYYGRELIWDDSSQWFGKSESYIFLTPVSLLSDEDAISILKLKLRLDKVDIGNSIVSLELVKVIEKVSKNSNSISITFLCKWGKSDNSIERLHISDRTQTPYQIVDKLRQLGYYIGDGIEIEYGWARFKDSVLEVLY